MPRYGQRCSRPKSAEFVPKYVRLPAQFMRSKVTAALETIGKRRLVDGGRELLPGTTQLQASHLRHLRSHVETADPSTASGLNLKQWTTVSPVGVMQGQPKEKARGQKQTAPGFSTSQQARPGRGPRNGRPEGRCCLRSWPTPDPGCARHAKTHFVSSVQVSTTPKLLFI